MGGPALTLHLLARHRRSLRLWLTAWMLVIYLCTQIAFSLVMTYYQTKAINDFFDGRIATRLQFVEHALRPVLSTVTPSDLAPIAERERRVLSTDVIIVVLDDRGVMLASSRPTDMKLDAGARSRPGSRHAPVTQIRPPTFGAQGAGARSLRAFAMHTYDEQGSRYALVLVADADQTNAMIGLVTRVALVMVPFGMLIVAVAAYIVAGVAVRPITRLTESARQLAPESIGQQMPPSSRLAEVEELRDELEHARVRLETGFATQERFLANVSHELKTPIATILTEIQLLDTSDLPPRVRAFFRSGVEELRRLATTVDTFSILTRVRHGKLQIPAAEWCHVRDMLLDSYADCVTVARAQGVSIDVRLPEGPHAEAAVHGNCELLRLLLGNILKNAVTVSAPGAVVSVRTQFRDATCLIRIRDFGPGVPDEMIPRMFQQFTQSVNGVAGVRHSGGTGLGLEVAMGIARLHAGTITFENCAEGGCEFTVRLPVRTEPETHA
ncbi:MAG: HAMP domain-containing sensor histidine kinase [Planctomycetota bacterium]|nr:HAMP domain-containing sensor histidine kinase [Planctomycetota bacterium]